MHYTDDPVADAERHISRKAKRDDAANAYQRYLSAQFLAAARRGDMTARAPFAPQLEGREQTVGQVMDESFDLSSGPTFDDVFALLCSAANGRDVSKEANELVKRAADAWAQVWTDAGANEVEA